MTHRAGGPAWEHAGRMGSDGQDRWIERVAPAAPPDLAGFTGERYLPGVGGEIEAEHIHRYLFAAPLCEGRDVLDIACGEGYGAALLSTVASSVVGVDIDEPTIEHARRVYPEVEFEPGSCDDIPYMRDSFDVVVSFETIEHIEDHDKFLREVRRVLRPGGLFICSTPDRDVYRHPDGSNPYHARELTRAEFEQLLARRFANIRVLGQRLVNGSVIARGGASRTDLVTTRDGEAFAKSGADEHATYLIAVCSDDRLPKIDDSILNDARYSIGRQLDLRNRLAALQRDLDAARSARDTAEAAMRDARARLEHTESALQSARAERDAAESERARLTEDRGRLLAEREAAERERDAAIRDAAAAQIDYERTAAELERVREEMIAAREKAAAAQANEAASRAERETLRVATAKAIAAKDHALAAQKAAEIAHARAEERARLRHDHAETANKEAAAARSEAAQARQTASTALREAEWMRRSRSWRWTAPMRLLATAGRAATIKGLGLGVRAVSTLGLPGTERLRIARRAALIRNSRLFDAAHYLAHNPDVSAAGVDPAWHFAARGGLERRDPGPDFSTSVYLGENPDVAAAGVHPFEHYITVGIREGRRAAPSGSTEASSTVPTPSQTPAPPATPAPVIEIKPAPLPRISVDPDQLARTKAIAFYLPQYHPIPENDQWWGKGFTEWTNVSRARPMFPGHRQPILPGELGFYDLRLPEARARQADLAREAGIHGFCYYHYWFNGRRVLERPLNEVLRLGEPDFPFCICWANENWTRRWDGLEQEILLRQQHSLASDRRFILDLIPYLEDDRYIRVDGRPVVLVYRPDLMVDACDTAAVWRDECARAGLGEIHLCAVQFRTGDPRPLGFDAAVEFPPHHFPAPEITARIDGLDPAFGGSVFDYAAGVRELIARPRHAEYRLYRGVMPSWDNTARRMEQAIIHHGATPDLYESWLRSAINIRQPEDGVRDNLVFINAWNEWAEGTVLEPRADLGRRYLDATARVLRPAYSQPTHDAAPMILEPAPAPTPAPSTVTNPAPNATIEAKVKRIVRSNHTLNAFVNRHPVLKSRAAALLRRTEEPSPESAPPTSITERPVRWRGAPANHGGPRLLIVSHDAALAGAQLIVLENARAWRERGIDARIVLLAPGTLEPEFARVFPTACVNSHDRRAGFESVLDDLASSGWTPDAAFCNTIASVDAMSAAARRGIPVVSAVYELPTSIDDSLGGRKAIERTLGCSKRVIVASAFVRDALANAYGIDPARLEPVHTGVLARTPTDRAAARTDIRKRLNVSDETFLVLGCGSIHHRKGTDLFVHAAAEARRLLDDRPVAFVWVGTDQSGTTFGNWCRHDAQRLGVPDIVHFVGVQHDPARWFAAADAFALTSREDPFPMVCLEALASGLGVVAFDGAGGAPEALLDSTNDRGIVVPYMDTGAMGRAIARLATEPDTLRRLSTLASTYATEQLGWDRYVDELDAALACCSPRFRRTVPAETALS